MAKFEEGRDVLLALNRIRTLLAKNKFYKKREESGPRDIRLGLQRMSELSKIYPRQDWKGVHVGGTNGKGSICAFLAGLFKLAGLSHGMYISPAFPERQNGVLINGRIPNKRMYDSEASLIEEAYEARQERWRFDPDEGKPGRLSPFELETATAFRIFDKMNVDYGIVEVGMGGETDATNIMKRKSVTVISKIGLDHQDFLGDTIEKIALVKAGIMRRGVPCIVDHTNTKEVIQVMRDHAQKVGTEIILSGKGEQLLNGVDLSRLEEYQKQNLYCAAMAFRHMFPNRVIDFQKLIDRKPFLPGRLEYVNITRLTGGQRKLPVLVDGGHNKLGIQTLADHVENKLRKDDEPITWVMALSGSESKPFAELIEALIRPQDNLAFVEFAPGPNMPNPTPAVLGRDFARTILSREEQVYDGEPTVGEAIQWAAKKSGEGRIIVTGSLYLLRDFYALPGVISARMPGELRPGRSQLWWYTKESLTRKLTDEEEKQFKRARRHWHLSPIRNPVFRNEGEPYVAPIREGVPDAQREAAYHQKKANTYADALKDVEKLLSVEAKDASAEDAEVLSTLRSDAAELEALAKKHRSAHYAAMRHVRGHEVLPGKKWKSYSEIFGKETPEGLSKPPEYALFANYREPGEPDPDKPEEDEGATPVDEEGTTPTPTSTSTSTSTSTPTSKNQD